MHNFCVTASGEASRMVGVRGRTVSPLHSPQFAAMLPLGCRDAYSDRLDEQTILRTLRQSLARPEDRVTQELLVEYYVSLKSNPFVVLTGPEGYGKLAFVQRFAETLLGSDSRQYALIPGKSDWVGTTGEGHYYRALHERFASYRFLDLLQEASQPMNAGKLYLACFSQLHPGELDYYFSALLGVGDDGLPCLNLPGAPREQRPSIPPNLLITATLDLEPEVLPRQTVALQHAGVIEFRPWIQPLTPPVTLPVAYQRQLLGASIRSVETARQKLSSLLGEAEVLRMRPSPALTRMLWLAGEALTSRALKEVTIYVANSFDDAGRGLFDPLQPQQNAQLAYDAQVAQRVLWRLYGVNTSHLRQAIASHLSRLGDPSFERAVA